MSMRILRSRYIWLAVLCVANVSQATWFTPGNVLVTQGNSLLEYTRAGELVQDILVPHPDTSRRYTTDIFINRHGRAHVLNIAPFDNDYLSIYDPDTESWTHHSVETHLGNVSDGDLSVSLDGKTAYTKKQAISLGDFATTNITLAGRGVAEISVGFDGYLYALDSGSPRHNVRVLDPDSFQIIRTFELRNEHQSRLNARGIGVTMNGDIFVSAWDGRIYAYDGSGGLIKFCQVGLEFNDLDLSSDGDIAAGSRFGYVAITDTSLESAETFETRGGLAYVCFVPEFTNSPPVANAGEDQTVFACTYGLAEVKLDGSGSYDSDGDELEYFWFEGDEQIATGVDPNVELTVGEHIIELIVDDGTESSEPNSVVVTVIGPVEADVHIVPRVINRRNHMKRIMVIIRLPEGISKHDISDEPFVLEPGGIEAMSGRVIGRANYARVFVSFDKAEVIAALPSTGMVEMTVTGKLESGQCISGADTVRIVQPRRRRARGLRRR